MKKLLLILPFLACACTGDDIEESNLNKLAAGKWFLKAVSNVTNVRSSVHMRQLDQS